MKEHKFKVVVLKDGQVVVDGVPVTEGRKWRSRFGSRIPCRSRIRFLAFRSATTSRLSLPLTHRSGML